MNNDNSRTFEELTRQYLAIKRSLPRKFAKTSVNFFKRNFRAGGHVGNTFTKWKKPSAIKKGKTTLIQSGNLRRAIKVVSVSDKRVVVGINKNIPYAKLHNEGGNIPITPKMRRFFWSQFIKTGLEQWKWMALTNKSEIEIPQRQFITPMGEENKALRKALNRLAIRELKKLEN